MNSTSPDNAEERFVQLFAAHERDLAAFIRSMGLDWVAVDDVMQTVSLVMWRKWREFEPESSFLQWARVIARFEVLKYRRSRARDRHVFREDVMDLLASAATELSASSPENEYRDALHQCLQSLPERSGRLIRAAYTDDRSIKDVAEEVGQSAAALYKALNRIREKLRQCIQNRLGAA
ncbi:MAG: sigma-70 family RNA polymerase sigma factor [Planctomycetota bacterium]